jgi:hypothetical protein
LRKENHDQRKQEGLIAMGCEAQQCAEAGDRTKRQALSESDSAHRRTQDDGKKTMSK